MPPQPVPLSILMLQLILPQTGLSLMQQSMTQLPMNLLMERQRVVQWPRLMVQLQQMERQMRAALLQPDDG
jgi:hypothetical protein